jgi:ribose-phosphate pyrophosphokinase
MMIENGALSVRAICTHAVLSADAYEKIEASKIAEMIVTNSIPLKDGRPTEKFTVLDIAPLFANVLHNLIENKSISEHFIIS